MRAGDGVPGLSNDGAEWESGRPLGAWMDPARPWSLEEELRVFSSTSVSAREGAWIDCERPPSLVAGDSSPSTINVDLDIKLECAELAYRLSLATTGLDGWSEGLSVCVIASGATTVTGESCASAVAVTMVSGVLDRGEESDESLVISPSISLPKGSMLWSSSSSSASSSSV